MNKTTLIVKTIDDTANFTVTGSEEKLSSFIKWADHYHRGEYDGSTAIICKDSTDIFVCRQKALREGLLSCISKNDIKSKLASVLA